MRSRRLTQLLFVLVPSLLALHAWHYYPYLSGDALVALRYAERWANGQGLTWTDGERIERTANFLFVVLTGVAAKLGAGLVPTARVLGFAGVLLAALSLGLDPKARGVSFPRLLVGGLLVSATAPFAVCSIAGLEHGLVAGLVALSFRLLERTAGATERRALLWSGAPLALIVGLRADGFLLALALLAGAACLPRPSAPSLRRVAWTSVPAAVTLAVTLAVRLLYYGAWLPSSSRRLLGEGAGAAGGLATVGRGFSSSSMLVLLALAATALAVRRGERFRLLPPWLVVCVWTAYLAALGGEPSPGFPELLPALVALCLVVADEVAADWSRIVGDRILILPVLALCAVLHMTQGTETAENRRAAADRSASDGLELGRTLRAAFGSRHPLLAVEEAGALPFATEFPSVDLGLEGGADVLRSAPDIVVFGAGVSTPASSHGRELAKAREFRRGYQSVRLEGKRGANGAEIFVRRERSRLGVVRRADRIEIPGYLFAGPDARADSRSGPGGELVAALIWDSPGALTELVVPAGRYRVDFTPDDPTLVVDVRCGDTSMQRLAPVVGRVFESDGVTPIGIVVAPRFGGGSLALRSAHLTPAPESQPTLRCARAGAPLRVSGAWLSSPMPRRVPWSHPSTVTFTTPGLLVDLGEHVAPKRLELTLSQNTSYALELRQEGRVVWPGVIERKQKSRRTNLSRYVFDLPKLAEGSGPFELFIKPLREGLGSSVGTVTLE